MTTSIVTAAKTTADQISNLGPWDGGVGRLPDGSPKRGEVDVLLTTI
jgi:hypothetical protein